MPGWEHPTITTMPCSVSNATAISSVKESFVYSDITFSIVGFTLNSSEEQSVLYAVIPSSVPECVWKKLSAKQSATISLSSFFTKKRGFNCSYPTMRSKLRYNVTPGKIICISSFTSQTVIPFFSNSSLENAIPISFIVPSFFS